MKENMMNKNNLSIYDVAQAAGVSTATVSRVMSGGSVSEATRRRVLSVVETLGYTPNAFARGLGHSSRRQAMKPFMDQDFLLETPAARTLYHDYAARMPIIDYHCHIDPRAIYENRPLENLAWAWLSGDHYKWRAMRVHGVPEKFITGDADDKEKFRRFAEMLPRAAGHPLVHWTHMELRRYLDIDIPLSGRTADEIWALSQKKLAGGALTVRGVIESSRVEAIGTTDDPADDLSWHDAIRKDVSCNVTVAPTFRPDKAVGIDNPGFVEYMHKLGRAAGFPIKTLDDLKAALVSRLDFFAAMGCRASDHGLAAVVWRPDSEQSVNKVFQSALEGSAPGRAGAESYRTALMLFLGRELHRRGLVMQLHYGARRDVNRRMFERLGPDTGFDCIGAGDSGGAASFLNALEETGELPKTILYALNPNDNALLDTVTGCFPSAAMAGKLQHGAAWWFNDTRDGMEQHLKTLAGQSVLGHFVGMLTDSRSFLSYTRHEYFRRILCNLLGGWAENGEYPYGVEMLGALVQDICYHNAKAYFGF